MYGPRQTVGFGRNRQFGHDLDETRREPRGNTYSDHAVGKHRGGVAIIMRRDAKDQRKAKSIATPILMGDPPFERSALARREVR
jgi:hypothetical protein